MTLDIFVTIERGFNDLEAGVSATINGGHGQIEEIIIESATCCCCGADLKLSEDEERQIEAALFDAAIEADIDARERALDRMGDR